MKMILVDSAPIIKALHPYVTSSDTYGMGVQSGLNHALRAICSAPTLDPVHAAGGCYCRECKYSSESPSGCSLHEIDDTQLSGFCSYGKPMEQEEGK